MSLWGGLTEDREYADDDGHFAYSAHTGHRRSHDGIHSCEIFVEAGGAWGEVN